MQQPSLQNVRIRSTRDALHVFYAVARNAIPLITRRLDAEERRAIIPGNVYVWEERSANSEATGLGMERWTDGMGWGPSRVRDDFLFYHQKECDMNDDPSNASTPWAQVISMYPSPRSRATSEAERLIKQTYSVRVSLPEDRMRGIFRKWHLTAYFSQQKLDRLNTVDNIQDIGDIPVPDGWFRSARRDGKSRREDDLPKSVVAKRLSQTPMEGLISSNCPSTPSSSSSMPATPSPRFNPTHLSEQLVPLEYLQNLSYPRRDPIDEQFLQRFSTNALTFDHHLHRYGLAFTSFRYCTPF
ncbi:Gti1/Pac2 family-domain-containing protein [Melanogaster broomeanus]|nr:Gti1/Pac2 family-domain-containing protein [Melanogaster broomeanus]